MKIQKKILVIGPYPILRPQHGGQKRAAALVEFYGNVFSSVKYTSVFHRGQYPEWGEDDAPLGEITIINQIDAAPYASELLSGSAIDKDIHVRSFLSKLLTEFKPDIIHIEQPFAYLGLKTLLKELGLSPKLIFGSQNVEYVLKERIFKELQVPNEVAAKLVAQTKQLEENLSKEADLVIAVNEEDASTHREMGARECYVIPNGINKDVPLQKDVRFWKSYMKKVGVEKVIIFVGSGHPPNWEGFLKLVGTDTTFMPPGSKIFVVGGVAAYFDRAFSSKDKYKNFWSRLETLGGLSEERLTALLSICDIVLLPILTLRGSNLKTAEAIASQKKIVSTSHAFKGFEKYKDLPNLFVADEPTAFRDNIVRALNAAYEAPSLGDAELSRGVLWESCLRPLEPLVRKIARSINLERTNPMVALRRINRKTKATLRKVANRLRA
ncbi:MAG TPA: glycosyltransferase [Candidatus Saccharibacteria bacterium]|nr:glycosyltransferase [Candidatus Saccharibacteria bacterium]HRK93980.1 glycosyltransferase [Candidatus Saccharibacteria bacterium]